MTQEFHLSITSLGSDRYLIRTEDTAMGVPIAEAQVEWPVESWLQLAQPAMDDPVLGLLSGKTNLNQGSTDLHQLGDRLYKALLQQENAIRESWLRAQGIAQNRNELLRFRLGLKESRLQRLPWEVLHQNGHPLTTRSDLTFTRYATNLLVGQAFEAVSLPEVGVPLRVLMVIAGPQDQNSLQLIQEKHRLQEILSAEGSAILPLDIHILEQPDRNALAQALEQGNYQILHYAGHSDFGESGGDLLLVNQQTGLTERLSGDDLAGLLVNNHVALTVFNSCRSGHTAGDDAEMDWRQQNLVQALVNRGVPSVIAMAERIPDEVAISFTQLFYKNLRKGYPIDLSLSRTRQGLISAFGSDQHYWALPILYLQPDFEGYLVRGDQGEDLYENAETGTVAAPGPLRDTPDSGLIAASGGIPIPVTPMPETGEADVDAEIASLVQQVSGTTAEEPPMPADREEVLTDSDGGRAGMAIYEALPEVAPPNGTTAVPTEPDNPPQDAQSTATKTAIPTRKQRGRQASSLLWITLGLVGALGGVGLGVALLRQPAQTTLEAQTIRCLPPGDGSGAFAAALIRQGEEALRQDRYADARQDFECALTQQLIGNTLPTEASDAIWPIVTDSTHSQMRYLEGRIRWQEISRLGEDELSFEQGLQQRTLAGQAQEVWAQTDDTFLRGRVARGFADYAMGDWGGAIENWDAAIALHEEQRQAQPDPVNEAVADPIILHAYAGLVMARTQLARLNPDAIQEDAGISTATPEEQEILGAGSSLETAIAREDFSRLQALDTNDQMTPGQLQIINNAPETWNNWLWTPQLLADWSSIHQDFSE